MIERQLERRAEQGFRYFVTQGVWRLWGVVKSEDEQVVAAGDPVCYKAVPMGTGTGMSAHGEGTLVL